MLFTQLAREPAGTDGVCNSLPSWEVGLEPQMGSNDPDCKAFPMYMEKGLGGGASFGGGSFVFNPPVPSG